MPINALHMHYSCSIHKLECSLLFISEPEEILLYADKDKGHIGLLPLGGANKTECHILATSAMPVAVGYDPVSQVVYWSDVKERAIYSIQLEDKRKTMFLNASHGLGTVDGKSCL